MCLFFPVLPIECEGADDGLPRAVVKHERSRRILLAINAAARASGLQVGSDAVTALARTPTLHIVERSIQAETRALKALASWAIQFSADVCLDTGRWLLWIEVAGSIRYFRGLASLTAQVMEGVKILGYSAQMGIAPTLEAAALLVRNHNSQVITDQSRLRAAIASHSLDLLALPPAVLSQLKASAIGCVGEALALPRDALARRFGPDVPIYLQQLMGDLPDPRPRYRVPERYRRDYVCAYPVTTVEGLLFPLRRLLQELQGFLRGCDKAIQSLLVTLRHRDAPSTVLDVRTSTPRREAAQLFELLRERLERTNLIEPVTDIRLFAAELVAPEVLQTDLFDDGTRHDAGWAALLDKLRARLGAAAVRHLGLSDDHRPEKAWVQRASEDEALTEDYPARPLWLLEPTLIEHLPSLCGTPERIEAGWWAGEDARRDYYLARSAEGARWWMYKDNRTQRWFLQGIWA